MNKEKLLNFNLKAIDFLGAFSIIFFMFKLACTPMFYTTPKNDCLFYYPKFL